MILFLDYDGTLVPIVNSPQEAIIDKNKKKILISLSRKYKIVIITGRDIKSFRKVFGKIPNSIFVISSHGSKIFRNETLVKIISYYSMPDVTYLKKKIKNMKGVILEEKEGCIALHYRNYTGDEYLLKRIFEEFTKLYPPQKVIEGKKVIEAFYIDSDKGKAVESFLRFVAWEGKDPILYIGDDKTDLYAIKKVKQLGGRTFFVGDKKPPEADCLLRSVEEVYRFLLSFK